MAVFTKYIPPADVRFTAVLSLADVEVKTEFTKAYPGLAVALGKPMSMDEAITLAKEVDKAIANVRTT